jgi:hypothetical protein
MDDIVFCLPQKLSWPFSHILAASGRNCGGGKIRKYLNFCFSGETLFLERRKFQVCFFLFFYLLLSRRKTRILKCFTTLSGKLDRPINAQKDEGKM